MPGNRTLWHPGAPTQTCYGVIQGAKLWGQWSKGEKPHLAKDSGRMQRMNSVKDRLTARKAYAAKEADRQCQKARGKVRDFGAPLTMLDSPTGLQVPSSCLRCFPLVNWVSPTGPTLGWYPNRKEGGGLRG